MNICFLTAEVELLIRSISTIIVPVTLPVRLNADVVLTLKQKGRAVGAIGITGSCSTQETITADRVRDR